MASKPKDWTGQRFGRLVAIENAGRKDKSGNYFWKFLCDCGNIIEVRPATVIDGRTKSCGCYQKELQTTHGMCGTREYRVWCGILKRCLYENVKEYKNYGGRGITVCKEWVESFEAFYKDMGKCPDTFTLERVDNSLGYFPENCIWADRTMQSYNTRKKASNTSGRTGVYLTRTGKWEARISIRHKTTVLYYGPSFEEACAAREEAELKYYGFTKE